MLQNSKLRMLNNVIYKMGSYESRSRVPRICQNTSFKKIYDKYFKSKPSFCFVA